MGKNCATEHIGAIANDASTCSGGHTTENKTMTHDNAEQLPDEIYVRRSWGENMIFTPIAEHSSDKDTRYIRADLATVQPTPVVYEIKRDTKQALQDFEGNLNLALRYPENDRITRLKSSTVKTILLMLKADQQPTPASAMDVNAELLEALKAAEKAFGADCEDGGFCPVTVKIRSAIANAEAALQPVAAPDGVGGVCIEGKHYVSYADYLALKTRIAAPDMVMVPREPTEAMIAAGKADSHWSDYTYIEIYKAMLAAAGKA